MKPLRKIFLFNLLTDIISHETLLERFKEIPQIENIRIKRELAKRETTGPDKAGPFHPPPPPEQEQETKPEAPAPESPPQMTRLLMLI